MTDTVTLTKEEAEALVNAALAFMTGQTQDTGPLSAACLVICDQLDALAYAEESK